MDACIMIIAIATFGFVIDKLLVKLNPAAWKNAAARVAEVGRTFFWALRHASLHKSGFARGTAILMEYCAWPNRPCQADQSLRSWRVNRALGNHFRVHDHSIEKEMHS
jgi:uncharacterized protein YjeT (DUF2065 family)